MTYEQVDNRQFLVQSAIFLVPVILHIAGLYLLYVTRHAQHRCNQFQRIYLTNLSVIEIFRGILKILYHLLLMSERTKQVAFYVWLIQTSGAFLWYILVLVLLTFDRFLEVFLNLKYRLYCTLARTRIALVTSFSLSFIMSLTFCICYNDFDVVFHVFPLYVWPLIEIIFLLVALFTYSYLFMQIRVNRRKMERMLHNLQSPTEHLQSSSKMPVSTVKQQFRHNNKVCRHRFRRVRERLYLPSILILAFVLLWVLPDMAVVVYVLQNTPIPRAVSLAVNVCYALAMSADVVIYVFSMTAVRRYLMKHFLKFIDRFWYIFKSEFVISLLSSLI